MDRNLPRDFVSVVDDDPAVRESLAALLEAHGFGVRLFESGQGYLRSGAAGEGRGLFLDVNLGDMSGFDVLRRMPRRAGHPVVMMTGRTDARLQAQAIGAGAVGLLEKPLEAARLFALIGA